MSAHLTPEAIAEAERIGRELPPPTSDQKALIAEIFGPLLTRRVAVTRRKPNRKRAAA